MNVFSALKLQSTLSRLTPLRSFLVAYSGGLDSHTLLHSLCQWRALQPDIHLRAVHFHHGLSPQDSDYAEHCALICAALGVEYECHLLRLQPKTGESLEQMARHARYKILENIIHLNEALLTGHQQNDQAETLLLQLFRGAGPKGMAAMAESIKFSKTYHLRPLLQFTRAQLRAYASSHQLKWIEDNSNLDPRFDRNFIRHQLLPVAKLRWPSVVATVARAAHHCADASLLLAQTADRELLNVQGSQPNTLSVEALSHLNASTQNLVIRRWLELMHLPTPSQIKLQQVTGNVLSCSKDAAPLVQWQGVEIRRYRDDLYAFPPLSSLDSTLEMTWDLHKNLELPYNLGMLLAKDCQQSPLYQGGDVIIRFRRGGEYCHPQGSKMRRSLKNLFQEWGIPPWERNRIPLIYQEGVIIQIPGHCVCVA